MAVSSLHRAAILRADGAVREPHHTLRSAVRALEEGHYLWVLDRSTGVVAILGASEFAMLTPLLVVMANGMWALARGNVLEARRLLCAAVGRLPRAYQLPDQGDGVARAALWPLPEPDGDRPVDAAAEAIARLACVLWRDQREIDRLYDRAAAIEPGDALREAAGQELSWTFHVHYLDAVLHRRNTRFPLPPTRQRKQLCERATQIVRLVRPTAGRVGEKFWRTAGGFDGLFAEVVADLGEARSPAPWQTVAGAEDVPIRLGLLRLWGFAQQARLDRMGWT